jgi:DNA-binding GntR family transcriptional regulator
MDALMSGDPEAAQEASRRHVRAAAAAALKLIAEAGKVAAAE